MINVIIVFSEFVALVSISIAILKEAVYKMAS